MMTKVRGKVTLGDYILTAISVISMRYLVIHKNKFVCAHDMRYE